MPASTGIQLILSTCAGELHLISTSVSHGRRRNKRLLDNKRQQLSDWFVFVVSVALRKRIPSRMSCFV